MGHSLSVVPVAVHIPMAVGQGVVRIPWEQGLGCIRRVVALVTVHIQKEPGADRMLFVEQVEARSHPIAAPAADHIPIVVAQVAVRIRMEPGEDRIPIAEQVAGHIHPTVEQVVVHILMVVVRVVSRSRRALAPERTHIRMAVEQVPGHSRKAAKHIQKTGAGSAGCNRMLMVVPDCMSRTTAPAPVTCKHSIPERTPDPWS